MTVQWSELGVFISVCGSAVVALIFALQKSSCDQISCCFGLCACHRPKEILKLKAKKESVSSLENA
jgi:hypothetical protein